MATHVNPAQMISSMESLYYEPPFGSKAPIRCGSPTNQERSSADARAGSRSAADDAVAGSSSLDSCRPARISVTAESVQLRNWSGRLARSHRAACGCTVGGRYLRVGASCLLMPEETSSHNLWR